ncbi:MAG: OadG family protein [Cyclobacteriaceae bacterium]|nr:OadG family protein [Cyclobacteriaceae bacterium]
MSNNIIRLFLALVFAISAVAVLAQDTEEQIREIRGKVLEIYDGKSAPLLGARIYVVGQADFVLSDQYGQFTMAMPDTATIVKVELFGYRNAEIEVGATQKMLEIQLLRNEGFMEDEGWIITIVGMGVIFSSLVLLFFVFKLLLPIIIGFIERPFRRKRITGTGEVEEIVLKDETITGEVAAAISLAIHLLESDMHDEESTILTIEKTVKNYSPWSSKIYTTHHQLRLPPNLKVR